MYLHKLLKSDEAHKMRQAELSKPKRLSMADRRASQRASQMSKVNPGVDMEGVMKKKGDGKELTEEELKEQERENAKLLAEAQAQARRRAQRKRRMREEEEKVRASCEERTS